MRTFQNEKLGAKTRPNPKRGVFRGALQFGAPFCTVYVGAGVPDGPCSRLYEFAAIRCEKETFHRRDVREAVPYNPK